MPQKRGLGSGIDVLIPKAQGTKKGEEKKKIVKEVVKEVVKELETIPINKIEPN